MLIQRNLLTSYLDFTTILLYSFAGHIREMFHETSFILNNNPDHDEQISGNSSYISISSGRNEHLNLETVQLNENMGQLLITFS